MRAQRVASHFIDGAYVEDTAGAPFECIYAATGETIARLHEDVTSTLSPPYGKRQAFVQIGDPIDLRDRLGAFQTKARAAIGELTSACEAAVQSGIDALNAGNVLPGAEPF